MKTCLAARRRISPICKKPERGLHPPPGTAQVNVNVAWYLENFTKVGGPTPSICLKLSIQIELDALIMYMQKLENGSPFSRYSPSKLKVAKLQKPDQ